MIPAAQAAATICDPISLLAIKNQLIQSMVLGIGMSFAMAMFWTTFRGVIALVAKAWFSETMREPRETISGLFNK